MSSPQPSLSPAEQQQQGQAALAAAMLTALAGAWSLLDVTRMAATLPLFTAAVRAVVQKYGRASAAAAIRHYKAQRYAAGVPGRFTAKMPPAVAVPLIESAVEWATRDLWRPPADQVGPFVPDVAAARKDLEAAAERLVLNQGRDATIEAVKADPKAKGWARVPHPDESLSGTCAFCLMLATRGAVYKTKAVAKFQAHNGCHCTAEAQFSGHYEPTATVRAAQVLWAESTKGLSGKDARLAFRRAVEGRTAPAGHESPAPRVVKPVNPDSARVLIGQFEKSLARMQANNRDGSLTRTIAATEARIAALRGAVLVPA